MLSAFRATAGLKVTSHTSVTPYILERRLKRDIEDFFNSTVDIHPDDLLTLCHGLKDMSSKKITKMANYAESHSVRELLIVYFRDARFKRILKRYNIV